MLAGAIGLDIVEHPVRQLIDILIDVGFAQEHLMIRQVGKALPAACCGNAVIFVIKRDAVELAVPVFAFRAEYGQTAAKVALQPKKPSPKSRIIWLESSTSEWITPPLYANSFIRCPHMQVTRLAGPKMPVMVCSA